MRKTLGFLLALAMLLCMAAPAAAAEGYCGSDAPVLYANVTTLNVHAGPAASYDVVATLAYGDKLYYQSGYGKDYFKVSYMDSDGKPLDGYVNSKQIISYHYVATKDVKAYTDLTSKKICSILKKGMPVEFSGEMMQDGKWWAIIRTCGSSAYCYAPMDSLAILGGYPMYFAFDNIPVYAAQSTKGKSVGKLVLGDYIAVMDITDGWAKILFGGEIGYVKSTGLAPSRKQLVTSSPLYKNLSATPPSSLAVVPTASTMSMLLTLGTAYMFDEGMGVVTLHFQSSKQLETYKALLKDMFSLLYGISEDMQPGSVRFSLYMSDHAIAYIVHTPSFFDIGKGDLLYKQASAGLRATFGKPVVLKKYKPDEWMHVIERIMKSTEDLAQYDDTGFLSDFLDYVGEYFSLFEQEDDTIDWSEYDW